METIKLTNYVDLERARAGEMPEDAVRTASVEGLVDTGATMLVLPADVVARLGVRVQGHRKARLANGTLEEVPSVGGIRLELLGRDMIASALVMPAGSTPLIGQIPLAELDLVVDPASRELRVNPASPDAPLLDALGA